MKKLVIAVAIITTAVASHAAVVSWKLSSSSSAASGATVYAFVGTYAEKPVFATLEAIQAAAYNKDEPYDTTTATKPVLSVTTAAQTLNSESLTKSAPYMYLVLVNSDESGYFVGAATDMSSKLYEPGSSSPGTLTIKENSVSFTKFSSGDVPEPTSAMLLLLGVAGLALRRKQA